jgi:PAS domain S-box-containing protein
MPFTEVVKNYLDALSRLFMDDALGHAMFLIDARGRVTDWNRGNQILFGYSADEMIGKSVNRLRPRHRRSAEEMKTLLGLPTKPQNKEEGWWLRKDKTRFVGECTATILPTDHGRNPGIAILVRDITERTHLIESLHRSEQLMNAILNAAADAIITIDEHGVIQSANTAAERRFGYSRAELIGRNVSLLLPEPYRGEHDGYLRNYCRSGQPKIIGIGRDVTARRKDGTLFPMHLSVSEVQIKSRRLFTGFLHDLTERRRLERRIIEAAADEQRRIGRDLHDGLCQDLCGIAFGIDALSVNPACNDHGKALAKLAATAREMVGRTRQIAHGLNPVDLDTGGLPAALEDLAQKVTESFGVRCMFKWDQIAQVRENVAANHLYRIAQEAVGNAIRHGKAGIITISLIESGPSQILSISDNGAGIPRLLGRQVKQGLAHNRHAGTPRQGMGLQTMQYRAQVIGGILAVTARKGGGTCVTCAVNREASAGPAANSDG